MLDSAQHAALAAVIRTGNFDQASKRLKVTQSAVSQRVKSLEERVGARVLHRGAPCTPTSEGKRLLWHFDEICLLEKNVAGDTSSYIPLNIGISSELLSSYLLGHFANSSDFLLNLTIGDEAQSRDWLQCGAVTAALTTYSGKVSGYAKVPLGSMKLVSVATQDYCDTWFPDGVTKAALIASPAVDYNWGQLSLSGWLKDCFGSSDNPLKAHSMPCSSSMLHAIKNGMGWGVIPTNIVASYFNADELCILNQHCLDVPVNWHCCEVIRPYIEALENHLIDQTSGLRSRE